MNAFYKFIEKKKSLYNIYVPALFVKLAVGRKVNLEINFHENE